MDLSPFQKNGSTRLYLRRKLPMTSKYTKKKKVEQAHLNMWMPTTLKRRLEFESKEHDVSEAEVVRSILDKTLPE